ICGTGKAKQKGKITVTVDNRANAIGIKDIYLTINQLPELSGGKSIARQLSNRKENYSLDIVFPELPPNSKDKEIKYHLSGELQYRFADGETVKVALPYTSKITVSQIYTSGFVGGIDEFL
ncbi:MAG: hypothetical protein ACK53E_26125, partial [Pseudanabaena sp.]